MAAAGQPTCMYAQQRLLPATPGAQRAKEAAARGLWRASCAVCQNTTVVIHCILSIAITHIHKRLAWPWLLSQAVPCQRWAAGGMAACCSLIDDCPCFSAVPSCTVLLRCNLTSLDKELLRMSLRQSPAAECVRHPGHPGRVCQCVLVNAQDTRCDKVILTLRSTRYMQPLRYRLTHIGPEEADRRH